MLKKTALSMMVLVSCMVRADVILDTHLVMKKGALQENMQRIIVLNENVVINVEGVGSYFLEGELESSTEDGAIITFRIIEVDEQGNEKIVAQPTLSCKWDEESTIEIGHYDEDNNEEIVRLTVIASHN